MRRLILIPLMAAALVWSCGKKSSSSSATSDDSDNPDGIDNDLATAYPNGLALAIFPDSVSSSTSLLLVADDKGLTPKAKKEEAKKILNGEGDSCLPPIFARKDRSFSINCYEFDQEMIFGTNPSSQTYGTKTGKDKNGEACLPSFARSQVNAVEGLLDRSLGLVQAAMCQANKDNKEAGTEILPPAEVGETLDLKEALKTALGDKASSVDVATMKRLTSQKDAKDNERSVFRTDVKATMADGKTIDFHLVHSPLDENNAEYDGKLWAQINEKATKLAASSTTKNQYLSVSYSRVKSGTYKPKDADGNEGEETDDYVTTAELRRANIATDLEKFAIVKGLVNYNANADFSVDKTSQDYGKYKKADGTYYSQANDAVEGMMYLAFSQKLSDNSGKISYFQNPGGTYGENARGMIFELSATDEGYVKGCGASGATSKETSFDKGVSIRKSIQDSSASLKIAGYFHPFFKNEASGNCPAPTESTEDGLTKYSAACTGGANGNYTISWFKPKFSDSTMAAAAATFVTVGNGTLFTRQCVKQNKDGKYEIDTAEIKEAPGFEVLDAANGEHAKKIPDPIETSFFDLAVE